jgi:hypothetical protein
MSKIIADLNTLFETAKTTSPEEQKLFCRVAAIMIEEMLPAAPGTPGVEPVSAEPVVKQKAKKRVRGAGAMLSPRGIKSPIDATFSQAGERAMDIEHEFLVYLRERFADYDDFLAACEADKAGALDWMAQLPPGKRQMMLARVAKALHTGPCSLIRSTGPKDEPTLSGHYIVVQHLLDDLLRNKRQDVTINVLASVTGEPLSC